MSLVQFLDKLDANFSSWCWQKRSDDKLELCLHGKRLWQQENQRISYDSVRNICQLLEKNPSVCSLNLCFNPIGDAGVALLAEALVNGISLVELNLMYCDIGPDGVNTLAAALSTDTTLQTLRLNGCKIGEVGGKIMASVLETNSCLSHLDLGETDQNIESLIHLSTVLQSNKTMIEINLNRPLLGTEQQDEAAVRLGKMLRLNSNLKIINIQKYHFTDYAISHLVRDLLVNTSLTDLDVSCNRIGRDGAAELGYLLSHRTGLEYLNISANRIDDEGARLFSKHLPSSSLKVLDISCNQIQDEGLCHLTKYLSKTPSMKKVFVWGNKIGEAACRSFMDLFASSSLSMPDTDVQVYTVDKKYYAARNNIHRNKNVYYCVPEDNCVFKLHETAVTRNTAVPKIIVEESNTDGHGCEE